MSAYLWIDLLIVLGPLLFSFEKKIRYVKRYPALWPAIGLVAAGYILWDILAHGRGDWRFNDSYLLRARVAGLPVEEILFFIVVPYSCLFIYEVIHFYRRDRLWTGPKSLFILGGACFLLLSWLGRTQAYTRTVFFVCALFIFTAGTLRPQLLRSQNFWIYVLVCFVPFFIVNYFLTALPVVIYNERAIGGLRILTIPVEDFFYSFSMLSFYAFVYDIFRQRMRVFSVGVKRK